MNSKQPTSLVSGEIVNCKSHLYADEDVPLVADKCAQNIEIKLNTELEKAHRWFTENRLTLNAKKTKYVIFGKTRKTKQLGDIQRRIQVKI